MLGSAAAVTGVGKLSEAFPSKEKQAAIRDQEIDALRQSDLEHAGTLREITFLDAEKNPRPYAMGEVAGMKFGWALKQYFGLDQARAVEEIDFKYQLALLWQKKLDLMLRGEEIEEFEEHTPGLIPAIEQIYSSYDAAKAAPMRLEDYRGSANGAIEQVERLIDRKRLHARFGGPRQADLFDMCSQAIDGDLLIGCAMTEVSPTEHPKYNLAIFEFLLSSAGRDFIERIPSLADRQFSFGPYQLTPSSVFNDGTTQRGASIIDTMLTRSVLPPNVDSVQGDDHHRAAYMLALYNVSLLVKDAGEKGVATLLRNPHAIADSISDYIPAAHHGSRDARLAYQKFADSLRPHQRIRSFAQLCHADMRDYMERTRDNRAALRLGTFTKR